MAYLKGVYRLAVSELKRINLLLAVVNYISGTPGLDRK
jgi:hypothetical protein